jgi:hypothetical protein
MVEKLSLLGKGTHHGKNRWKRDRRRTSVSLIEFDVVSVQPSAEPKSRTVVRLTTSFWCDGRGIHQKKSLTHQKRLSSGWQKIFDEDDFDISQLTNLDTSPDGLYEIVVSNVSRDWETGVVDGWDYTLIPFKKEAGR